MAQARTYNAEALVLKCSPLGEADMVVTLYTREAGKVRAVARGSRRNTSKLVGHLIPLTVVRLSLARGRNLDIITQAQIVEGFASVKGDLEAVSRGLYLAELMDGFSSESSPNQPLYQLALTTLKAIGKEPASDLPLRFFELHLLGVTGFMLELYQCVECRRPLAEGQHRFSPNGGGALCLDCKPAEIQVRPLSVRALKVLRLLHRTTGDMPALKLDHSVAQELKTSLSAAIQYWLDKEIQANSFLEHLHSGAGAGVYS